MLTTYQPASAFGVFPAYTKAFITTKRTPGARFSTQVDFTKMPLQAAVFDNDTQKLLLHLELTSTSSPFHPAKLPLAHLENHERWWKAETTVYFQRLREGRCLVALGYPGAHEVFRFIHGQEVVKPPGVKPRHVMNLGATKKHLKRLSRGSGKHIAFRRVLKLSSKRA